MTKLPALSEKSIQNSIINLLCAKRWNVVRFNGGATKTPSGGFVRFYEWFPYRRSSGVPDLLVWKGEKVFFLEVKKGTGRVSPDQKQFMESIHNAIPCHVVRSIDDVILILEEIEREQ